MFARQGCGQDKYQTLFRESERARGRESESPTARIVTQPDGSCVLASAASRTPLSLRLCCSLFSLIVDACFVFSLELQLLAMLTASSFGLLSVLFTSRPRLPS